YAPRIEVAGRSQRLGTEQLVDPGGPLRSQEYAPQIRAKHGLTSAGNGWGEHLGGYLPKQPFIGPAAQLVLRRDLRAKLNHLFIEKWIPALSRGLSYGSISFGMQ